MSGGAKDSGLCEDLYVTLQEYMLPAWGDMEIHGVGDGQQMSAVRENLGGVVVKAGRRAERWRRRTQLWLYLVD